MREGRPIRRTWNTVAGDGFGLCSCGAKSPTVDNSAKRKRWHADHKAEVMGG